MSKTTIVTTIFRDKCKALYPKSVILRRDVWPKWGIMWCMGLSNGVALELCDGNRLRGRIRVGEDPHAKIAYYMHIRSHDSISKISTSSAAALQSRSTGLS